MKTFFEDFDFGLLDSSGFKEDSVREDLVMPILSALGYSSSGEHRIDRSRNLVDPFVYIGTTSRKISIFPDYTLSVASKPSWILDAKSPSEEIRKGKNREQAYSYAMHKDIRVTLYALCNGRRFLLFHVSREEPLVDVDLKALPEDLSPLTRHLTPRALLLPHAVNYWPDLGLHHVLLGFTPEDILILPGGCVELITRLDDESFSINSGADIEGRDLLGSFDFGQALYEKFLSLVPAALAVDIRAALKRYPYHLHFPDRRVNLTIRARLGNKLITKEDDQFVPFNVIGFEPSPPISDETKK